MQYTINITQGKISATIILDGQILAIVPKENIVPDTLEYWEFKEAEINFTRIDSDGNGNPRYVCHYTNLLTDKENEITPGLGLTDKYKWALKRARKIGGGKFHNKQYGGGIVFQSYNIKSTEKDIKEALAS